MRTVRVIVPLLHFLHWYGTFIWTAAYHATDEGNDADGDEDRADDQRRKAD